MAIQVYTQEEIDVLVRAIKLLQDEIHRKEEHHRNLCDALSDASFRRGMKAGWNYCARNDNDGFKEAVEAHRRK